jgi:hypothetical protein
VIGRNIGKAPQCSRSDAVCSGDELGLRHFGSNPWILYFSMRSDTVDTSIPLIMSLHRGNGESIADILDLLLNYSSLQNLQLENPIINFIYDTFWFRTVQFVSQIQILTHFTKKTFENCSV